MIATMSQREKVLAAIVGASLILMLNVFLFKIFLANHALLRTTLAKAQAQMAGFQQQESERTKWAQREVWLDANLPALGDADVANKQIRETLLDLGKKHTVTIESPAPGVPNNQPYYTSLGVRIECKAPWTQMGNFLYDLQTPGQFLVVEALEMKVDPADKTQLRATITVAKWFAPKKSE